MSEQTDCAVEILELVTRLIELGADKKTIAAIASCMEREYGTPSGDRYVSKNVDVRPVALSFASKLEEHCDRMHGINVAMIGLREILGGETYIAGIHQLTIDLSDQASQLKSLYDKLSNDIGDGQDNQLDTLQSEVRKRDEFIALLAHELRNHATPVHNGIEVLKANKVPTCGGKDEKILDMMERQTRNLIRLTDELLDISRYSNGKLKLEIDTVDMCSVLEAAVEASQPLFERANQNFRLSIAPRMPKVDGDYLRLVQAFTNLLNNGSKFTPDGGNISLTADGTDDSVCIEVSDSGCGIAPEFMPHVFDLYAQAGSRHERNGGLGIGLTLVKEIINSHGGIVEVKSPGLNRGCTFVVNLPSSGRAHNNSLH